LFFLLEPKKQSADVEGGDGALSSFPPD